MSKRMDRKDNDPTIISVVFRISSLHGHRCEKVSASRLSATDLSMDKDEDWLPRLNLSIRRVQFSGSEHLAQDRRQ